MSRAARFEDVEPLTPRQKAQAAAIARTARKRVMPLPVTARNRKQERLKELRLRELEGLEEE